MSEEQITEDEISEEQDTIDCEPDEFDSTIEQQIEKLRDEIELLRDHDTQARYIANEIAEASQEYELARKQASFKKKILEELFERLAEHSRSHVSPGPLFDQQDVDDNDEPDDDAWRERAIDELDVAPNVHLNLMDHTPPIETIGELADFTGDTFNLITDIKGIGPETAEAIVNAMAKWFADNRDICPPVKSDDQHDAGDDQTDAG